MGDSDGSLMTKSVRREWSEEKIPGIALVPYYVVVLTDPAQRCCGGWCGGDCNVSESLCSILTSQPRPQAAWLAAGWLTGGESCGAGGLMPGVSSGASGARST